ncbi:MAG: hypothetical protein ACLUOI_16875 [Eisenbergiella sp.]
MECFACLPPASNYRRICPETEIWLGGPEVSYKVAALLSGMILQMGIAAKG